MKKLIFVIMLCLLTSLCFSLVACEPTMEDVAGTYYAYDYYDFETGYTIIDGRYLQLNSDGTGTISSYDSFAERYYDSTITYTLNGNKMTIIKDGNEALPINGGIKDGVVKLENQPYFCKEGITNPTKKYNGIVYSIGLDGNFEVAKGSNKDLTSVKIKSKIGNVKVTSIGYAAFLGCDKLTDINIPKNITHIGAYAFGACTRLEKIIIPDSITEIDDAVFYRCDNLKEVTFGKNANNIRRSIFFDCDSLETIIVSPNNTNYHVDDNCIIETETKTLAVGFKTSVIPSDGSVTSIGYTAFSFSSLDRIVIPDGVISINASAFLNCANLENITIPESVISIGERAFAICPNLTDINYNGTIEQWNAIEKISGDVSGWDCNTGDYTIHCTDGDIAKGE
ncbi:MAG: leucine-rich repeat domain-containing protein [Clostridiales bacterium]|nr:leucine-rich repeat domain-containing protein [Clostridiales bacterium]